MNVELNIETVPDNDVEMLPTENYIIQDEQVFSAMTVKMRQIYMAMMLSVLQ